MSAQRRARFCLPAGDPIFAGHFPAQPIVPGAWLLDQVMHALAADSPAWRLSSAKFLSPVAPGESIDLHVTNTAGSTTVGFELRCGDRVVARGSLSPLED